MSVKRFVRYDAAPAPDCNKSSPIGNPDSGEPVENYEVIDDVKGKVMGGLEVVLMASIVTYMVTTCLRKHRISKF